MGFEIHRKQVNKYVHVRQKLLQLTQKYNLQVVLQNCIYPVAHVTLLCTEQCLLTKSKILCFALKCTIFVLSEKYLQVMWSGNLGIHM